MSSALIRSAAPFFAGLVLLGSVAYLLVLTEPFVFNDDTFFWAPGRTCLEHPQVV
jgi:hypothetical protein